MQNLSWIVMSLLALSFVFLLHGQRFPVLFFRCLISCVNETGTKVRYIFGIYFEKCRLYFINLLMPSILCSSFFSPPFIVWKQKSCDLLSLTIFTLNYIKYRCVFVMCVLCNRHQEGLRKDLQCDPPTCESAEHIWLSLMCHCFISCYSSPSH